MNAPTNTADLNLLSRVSAYFPVTKSIHSKIVLGAFWSLAGPVISRGLTLVSMVFVARMLGRSSLGELNMLQSTVGALGTLAGLGLGLAATKYTATLKDVDSIRTGRILSLIINIAIASGLISSLAVVAFSHNIALNILNAPNLHNSLSIVAWLILLYVTNGVQTGILSGLEAFKSIAIINLLTGIISFPMIVIGAWKLGIEGASIGLVASAAITSIINHFVLSKEFRKHSISIRWRDCWKEQSILWNFALPAALSGILVSPTIWLANMLLIKQQNGYEELGILSVALQWQAILLFIPSTLNSFLLSTLSGSNNRDQEGFWSLIRITLIAYAITTAIPAALVCIFSGPITNIYGNDFIGHQQPLRLLAISAIFMSLSNVTGLIIASSSNMWWGFAINLLWSLTFVAFTYVLIYNGSIGWAYAHLASYICHFVWTSIYLTYRFRNAPTSPSVTV